MSEILLVLAAALLLFGSKRLPEIARSLGKAMDEFRRATREVTDEIMQVTEEDPPRPDVDGLLPPPDEPRDTVKYLPPERRRCSEEPQDDD